MAIGVGPHRARVREPAGCAYSADVGVRLGGKLIDLYERRRRGASGEREVGENRVLPFQRRGLRGP
jgi:hypothetical protein